MTNDPADYKEKYDRERTRRLQLEKEVAEKEALLAEEHKRMLEVEDGLLNDAQALGSVEQQHIKVLKHQLRSEYQRRAMAEKERDGFERESEEYGKKLAECENTVGGLEEKVGELTEDVAEKDRLLSDASKHSLEQSRQVYVMEKPKDVTDVEDIKELLDRLGSMKVDEMCRMLEIEKEVMIGYIKKLQKEGFVKVQHTKTKKPTIKATKKLVSEMSKQRMELRKRGRSK